MMIKECWNCKYLHDDSDFCDSCLAGKKPTKWEPGSIYIPDTNADRIRRMTDEELADFFFESPEIEFDVCEYCKNFGGHSSDYPCRTEHGLCEVADKNEAFKKWLKQPAGDDC